MGPFDAHTKRATGGRWNPVLPPNFTFALQTRASTRNIGMVQGIRTNCSRERKRRGNLACRRLHMGSIGNLRRHMLQSSRWCLRSRLLSWLVVLRADGVSRPRRIQSPAVGLGVYRVELCLACSGHGAVRRLVPRTVHHQEDCCQLLCPRGHFVERLSPPRSGPPGSNRPPSAEPTASLPEPLLSGLGHAVTIPGAS